MRCRGTWHTKDKSDRKFLGFLIVFLFFPTILLADTPSSLVIMNDTHAAHRIHDDITKHSVNKKAVLRIQNNVVRALYELHQLSSEVIANKIALTRPKTVRLPAMFPVRSPLLQPGKVIKRAIHVVLPGPIFIVGNDALSIHWMRHYQKRLRTLQAKGFVVNVHSRVAMKTLHAQFPHLALMPLPGDQLASWLKLKHYPALISNSLIEQ